MLTWREFKAARPDLAEAGRELMYQFGVGLAFLSTVRRDGGPRMHPICPLILEGRLVAFIIPSPKASDLRRDGRYTLHSFPRPNDEDAFYVTGIASEPKEAEFRDRAARQFWADRPTMVQPPEFEEQRLFEFPIESCLLTRTTGHGDPNPQHMVWKALQ